MSSEGAADVQSDVPQKRDKHHSTSPNRFIPRHSERLIEDAIKDTRVILINGARPSGKRTLARQMARRHDAV